MSFLIYIYVLRGILRIWETCAGFPEKEQGKGLETTRVPSDYIKDYSIEKLLNLDIANFPPYQNSNKRISDKRRVNAK